MVNRTQALVLGFFLVAWMSLLTILVAAPEVYDRALGVLRVPVAILQLTGAVPADAPNWYVAFQGLLGLAQLAIGLAMLAGYRRSGVWGAF